MTRTSVSRFVMPRGNSVVRGESCDGQLLFREQHQRSEQPYVLAELRYGAGFQGTHDPPTPARYARNGTQADRGRPDRGAQVLGHRVQRSCHEGFDLVTARGVRLDRQLRDHLALEPEHVRRLVNPRYYPLTPT